jgi:transcriptional regulator with XRE-family HTH domain
VTTERMERHYEIGETVRRLRRARVINQRELADRAGIHWVTLSRIETGHKAESGTVRKLAEALGVEVQELLDENQV